MCRLGGMSSPRPPLRRGGRARSERVSIEHRRRPAELADSVVAGPHAARLPVDRPAAASAERVAGRGYVWPRHLAQPSHSPVLLADGNALDPVPNNISGMCSARAAEREHTLAP